MHHVGIVIIRGVAEVSVYWVAVAFLLSLLTSFMKILIFGKRGLKLFSVMENIWFLRKIIKRFLNIGTADEGNH